MGNAANGWTPERRKKQIKAIRRWKPWKQPRGPRSPKGKATAARNAWTGGHWLMLPKAVSEMNEVIRQQRKGIGLKKTDFGSESG